MKILLALPYRALLRNPVSNLTAIAVRAEDDRPAKIRRCKVAKVVIVSLVFALLMYFGLRGAQHAKVLARLADITLMHEQLQRELDRNDSLREMYFGGTAGDTQSIRALPNDLSKAMANNLKRQIEQFEARYGPNRLSDAETLDIRLAKAGIANLEQRFSHALEEVTSGDERVVEANEAGRARSVASVLRVRGDALYGVRKWQEALDCYRRLLSVQPNGFATMKRVADCQYRLGQRNEALAAYGALAEGFSKRGDALRLQGKLEAANQYYTKAAEMRTWLIEQERQTGAPPKTE